MSGYERNRNSNGSVERGRRRNTSTERPHNWWPHNQQHLRQQSDPQQNGWSDKSGWRDVSRVPALADTVLTSNAATIRFVLLCSLWYMTSALSSNTGKAIMQIFKYPVTLTFVQFGFIAGYCLLLASPAVGMTKIRKPTAAILQSTFPMALFQVGGHILSSTAISRIPVSTVHTIKALSPLFTVAAYALLFGVKYSPKTYISLLPLTLGVMLACTFDVSASNTLGLVCAFLSAIVFVSSNIFFKKLMPTPTSGSSSSSHKLDKINLLFYASGMAFLLMIPIWMYYDLAPLFNRWSAGTVVSANKHVREASHGVLYYFFMNGTVHFAQNIIAFAILATTSPVTYSIASLIKRIAVICIAIVWFNQSIHPVQGVGICLTFFGLWLYNQAKGDVERGEKQVRRVEAQRELLLPSTKSESNAMNGTITPVSFLDDDASLSPSSYPMRPIHPRHHNGSTPTTLTPINTILAANAYAAKYDVTVSPNPIPEAYPSPPESLDSPPPERNDDSTYGVSHNSMAASVSLPTMINRRALGPNSTGHVHFEGVSHEIPVDS